MPIENKTWSNLITFTDSGASGKVRCEPEWHWQPPPLPDYDLWYAFGGTGTIQVNGQTYPVRAGSCFLFRPGDRIQGTQDPADRLRVIYVHFKAHLEEAEEAGRQTDWLPPSLVLCEDAFEIEHELGRIIELKATRQDAWRTEEFDLLMKLALIRLIRIHESRSSRKDVRSHHHSKLVQQVIGLLTDAQEWEADYEMLARSVQLSPRYLSSLFKTYTGMPLKTYITRLRLERAKILLTETSMSVTQAADALGYSDIGYFSKLFKSEYGYSPREFRNRTQAASPTQ